MTVQERVRFWKRVDQAGECWRWLGGKNNYGYGNFGHKKAHRVAYELIIGPIPDGLTLDHLCKNRACVNPWHLEPVTLSVNVMRGDCPAAVNARKTHCDKGHPFDEENTSWRFRKDRRNPKRVCRTCTREWFREKRELRARAA